MSLFDGDQIAVHMIPKELSDETMKLMSPRYVTKYKKNLQNIHVFNHETLKYNRGFKTPLIAGSTLYKLISSLRI